MATVELDHPDYHLEIVSIDAVDITLEVVRGFLLSLRSLRYGGRVSTPIDPISLEVSQAGPNFSYELTAEQGRFYNATLTPTGRARTVTGTSAFTLPELLSHNPVIEGVFGLIDLSVTGIEVAWT